MISEYPIGDVSLCEGEVVVFRRLLMPVIKVSFLSRPSEYVACDKEYERGGPKIEVRVEMERISTDDQISDWRGLFKDALPLLYYQHV